LGGKEVGFKREKHKQKEYSLRYLLAEVHTT
jgi:hypothetical protein